MGTKKSYTSSPTGVDLARAIDKVLDALKHQQTPRPPSRPQSVEAMKRFVEELARELSRKKGV